MSEFTSFADVLKKLKHVTQTAEPMSRHDYQQSKVDRYNKSEGNLHEQDGYNCDVCKNKGFIAKLGENDEDVYAICKCQKIRSTLKRAKRSGLGDVIRDYTFDKYNATEDWQKSIKTKAQDFCKDEDARWFYIGGQVGSGKTHLCTAISAHYIKAGREVKYMLWSEDSKRLKALVNEPTYQDEISVFKDVDVLYIDDFLKVRNGETPTTADMNLAFEIINNRLLSKDKITIISSEKTLDEILDYDEATMSRIYQNAGRYNISVGRDKSRNYRFKEANNG